MDSPYNIRMPPAAIRAEVIPDRTELRLSDSLHLEIAIEGPAPLRVELPKEWLGEDSAGLWKMQPLGPPSLRDIAEGQRWSQSFRLDPYVPGSPVPLIFVPVKVNDAEVNLPSFSIEVTTAITRAHVDEARPITGMETLPPRPPAGSTNYVPGIASAVLVVVVSLLVLRQHKRPVAKPSPADQATDQLRQLDPASEGYLHALTETLRDWLDRGRGIPAKSRTVAELRTGNAEVEPIFAILDRCDRSRFSGETLETPEREDLRSRALKFISDDATTPTEPEP